MRDYHLNLKPICTLKMVEDSVQATTSISNFFCTLKMLEHSVESTTSILDVVS